MHVELEPNGDLIVIAKGVYVARLDWDSKVLWRRTLVAHHDLDIAPDGRLFVLSHKVKEYSYHDGKIPIMDDAVAILSPKGRLLEKRRLFLTLRRLIPNWRLKSIAKRLAAGATARELSKENAPSDTTHANSIQILRSEIPTVAPAGSFLMSFRELDRIAILDAKMRRVLWSFGRNEFEEQHHATLLENGNIMVFDNGARRKHSRVVEVNPKTREIEWSYTSPDFYTRLRGAAQKLPGGDVLITESDRGHVFEVTPEGRIVWEFWNPDVVDEENPTRAVIYRMRRYAPGYLAEGLLEPAPSADGGGSST
jgi:hypothetical protein